MRMADTAPSKDDLRPEYDEALFQGAERGKYAERFQAGTNIVRLHADVAESFPDERSVNEALRFLQQLAQDANRLTNS